MSVTSNASHPALPATVDWMKCDRCGHVHTRHFWNEAGLASLTPSHATSPLQEALQEHELKRQAWQPLIQRVIAQLGGYQHVASHQAMRWMDLGCGDGSLMMTAADHGFEVSGIDTDAVAVSHLKNLGYHAEEQSIDRLATPTTARIVSITNVLQHLPQPKTALLKISDLLEPKGLLVVSVPVMHSSTWKLLDAAQSNPFWSELTHLHNFTRISICELLKQCGFEVLDLAISHRYKAHLEIIAQRSTS